MTAETSPTARSVSPLRYLDVAVIVVGAIPTLLLGAPVFVVAYTISFILRLVDGATTAAARQAATSAGAVGPRH